MFKKIGKVIEKGVSELKGIDDIAYESQMLDKNEIDNKIYDLPCDFDHSDFSNNMMEYINNTISDGAGDPLINMYTDAFIDDLRSKLELDFECQIFGGSTLKDYRNLYLSGAIIAPMIVVLPNYEFKKEEDFFEIVDENGNRNKYYYSPWALPLKYGVSVVIIDNNQIQCDEIRIQIRQKYRQGVVLNIEVPQVAYCGCSVRVSISLKESEVDNSIPFTKAIKSNQAADFAKMAFQNMISQKNMDESSETVESENMISQCDLISDGHDNENYFGLRKTEILFNKIPLVYFSNRYNSIGFEENQRLKASLVEQANYHLNCAKHLQGIKGMFAPLGHSWGRFKAYYTGIIGEKKESTVSKLGSVLLDLKEQSELKDHYKKTGVLDKELFEKAFEQSSMFPQLYESALQKEPYESVKKRVLAIADEHQSFWKDYCAFMNIPDFPLSEKGIRCEVARSLQDNACLDVYCEEMKNSWKNIDQLFEYAYQRMMEEEERQQQRDVEREEMMNTVKSVAKTVGGAAVASKASSLKKSQHQEREPWYTCGISCHHRFNPEKSSDIKIRQNYSDSRYCKLGLSPSKCEAVGGKPVKI